jgi:enoyl-CoA hydratase/carnithine racemase
MLAAMAARYDLPEGLDVAVEGGLRVITLNRPDDRNAATTEMMFAFGDLFDALAQDDEARVAILTGAGKAFSSGADYNFFVRSLDDPDFARSVQEHQRRVLRSIVELPIPIIAAVNGAAVGYGATLGTICDIVLMSDRAFLIEPHVNIGLVVGDGISFAWPLYTSLLKAKELIFTGDRITADQAVEYGLANRVVEHDSLMDEARALAAKLLEQPRIALRETKKIMNTHLRVSLTQVLDTTLLAQFQQTISDEHQTRARAFLDSQRRNQPPAQG